MTGQDAHRLKIERGTKKALQPGGMSIRRQRAVHRFITEQLTVNPLERIPERTKELRGRFRGIVQYDVDENCRLHYRVDPSERIVYILYIGPHPKW